MRGEGREEEPREEGRGGERGQGRGEAFLVIWPRRLSALNPPLFILIRHIGLRTRQPEE